MDRRTLEPVLLGVLAVVAIATAARTLPSATSGGGGLGGAGEGSGVRGPPPALGPLPPPPEVDPVWLLLGLLVVMAVALYVVYRHPRAALGAVGAVVGFIAFIGVVALLASVFQPTLPPLPGRSTPPDPGPTATPGGAEGERGPTDWPAVVLAVAGLLLLTVVAVLVRWRGREPVDPPDDGTEPSVEAAAVGRAAGDAADRLEVTADLENEVFRAWREMTRLLDVRRPGSTTAGEFADAAIEAGIEGGDVAELTRLFEDVRYGADEATPATERRALDVLRRIEGTYAGEGGT